MISAVSRYRILAIASAAVLLFPTLLLPLNWDNEIYQSMATDFLRWNLLPYIGSWDQNFPGIVILHAISIVLFGNSALGFRIFDFLVHIGLSWMLFEIVHRWFSARVALASTLLYNIRYMATGILLAGQRDPFASFFLLSGIMALFTLDGNPSLRSKTPSSIFAFVAGFSLAFSSIIRPTYFPLIFFGALWLYYRSKRVQDAVNVRSLLFYSLGIVVLYGSIFLLYAFHQGGLREFFLATVRFNLEIYGPVHILPTPYSSLWTQKFYILFGLLGILCILYGKKSMYRKDGVPIRQDIILIAGIFGTGLCSLVVMGKYILYHYELVMLVLIPLCVIGMKFLVELFPSRLYRCALGIAFVLYIFFRVSLPSRSYVPLISSLWNLNSNALANAQDSMVSEPGYRMSIHKAIASYIARTTPMQACYACISCTAGIRWLTPRPCVGRFTTFYSIAMRTPEWNHPDFQQIWRKEFVHCLQTDSPYYIVMANGPKEVLGWIAQTPQEAANTLPGFDDFLTADYAFDTSIGGYSIWKRMH